LLTLLIQNMAIKANTTAAAIGAFFIVSTVAYYCCPGQFCMKVSTNPFFSPPTAG
jgi:hypothetical protein